MFSVLEIVLFALGFIIVLSLLPTLLVVPGSHLVFNCVGGWVNITVSRLVCP